MESCRLPDRDDRAAAGHGRRRHGDRACDARRVAQSVAEYPALRELYTAKESLVGFYRVRSYPQAARILTEITDRFARSQLPEIQTLRSTLLRWRREVLAYFQTRLTNGMTEGFNLKAKLVKRRAYGYRSFRNYRLRLLNACA